MNNEKELLELYQRKPTIFYRDIWGLEEQKILPEYKEFYNEVLEKAKTDSEELFKLKLYMFEKFQKGKHITWQQAIIIKTLEENLKDLGEKNLTIKISIKTGHGIGKSNEFSRIIVWFLFCFYKSKIGLTAPDSQTLYDALFSEVGNAVNSILSEDIKKEFIKTTDYLRIRGMEDQWFARCKTGKKENPEALAGLHADSIMLIGEEASGLPEEILNAGNSNLTGRLNIFLLIGNPLRNNGYFYDTFKLGSWINLSFSGEESPITGNYPEEIKEKYGEESDEYRRRILGKFPREDILDDKGFVQLVLEKHINKTEDLEIFGQRKILGVDCAGEGKDLTTWVLRDNLKAIIVGSEKISDENSIANKTLTIAKHFGVKAEDIVIDNFGKGANVGVILASLGYKPTPIYVGDTKLKVGEIKKDIEEEGQKFLNLRALLFWRLKKWLEGGGQLGESQHWEEIKILRYKRTLKDQIQIMSKEEMRKNGFKSPDFADALSLTFYFGKEIKLKEKKKSKIVYTNYGGCL
ncbi:hypothetical protein DLH72_04995 [Candidatus Gracilibacteria bacterium]|nr:MAG: hypothetical protein DLH72_04995 [Candidatus Gracilibacteria bacterium]